MNKLHFIDFAQTAYIECEEYFPLKIMFNSDVCDYRFVGFYKDNENLLEFTVDNKNGLIKKIQVTTCKNYQIFDTEYKVSEKSENQAICLLYPSRNNCSYFNMQVYKNAVKITILENPATKFYASDKIIFGVDDKQNLVSLIITNMNQNQINHTIFELENQS